MKTKSISILPLLFLVWFSVSCSDDNESTPIGGSNTNSSIVINTTAVSNISTQTAESGGQILSDGGSPIVERGVCWSTSPNPTIADSRTEDNGGVGVYTSLMSGLSPSTQYYVRAYAISSTSIGYGNQLTFSTVAYSLPVDVDGNIYDTIAIGNQVWLKQNLKVSKYRNGNSIPTNLTNTQWLSTSNGAYAIYNDSALYDGIYGKLYNWYAVSDPRGLCPVGWHVPDMDEWDTLFAYLGGDLVAGGAMKDIGIAGAGGYWNAPNTGATNSSGFTGIPGGMRNYNGNYFSIGESAEFWSSTQYSPANAVGRYLIFNNAKIVRVAVGKNDGKSIRCLRD